jgi:hypothetical protein
VGSPSLEKWFNYLPQISRDSFLQQVGFDSNAKYILFVGSSPFIAPDEVSFFQRWYAGFKKSSLYSEYNVIIRPHPQNYAQWKTASFDKVTIYPKQGEFVTSKDAEVRFFNSIYFSEAVVGVNSSSMIEAKILNKPVFTVEDHLMKRGQGQTLHFSYLKDLGFVTSARDFENHFKQIESNLVFKDSDLDRKKSDNIRQFLWPSPTKPTELIANTISEVSQSGDWH